MAQNLDRLMARLQEKNGQPPHFDGSDWRARCPRHQDDGQSLSFHLTSGGHVLLECNAGCQPGDVMRSLGMMLGDLFGEQRPDARPLLNFRPDTPRHESLPPPPKVGPIVKRLDQCTSAEVEWLWPARIPRRKLTLLLGDPGLGKSLLALDLAARVSRGGPLPDELPPPFTPSATTDSQNDRMTNDTMTNDPNFVVRHSEIRHSPPASVLMLSSEDDAQDTLRPRLHAAGADLSRVVVLEGIHRKWFGHGKLRRTDFALDLDLSDLEKAIRSLDRCRLVVLDPLAAYLGRRDTYNNVEMRRMLHPLTRLAAQTGVAVLAINHFNKLGRGPAIYRSMGSLALAATARSVLAVLADPHDASARVLVSLKNNVAAPVDGIRFRIQAASGATGSAPPTPVVHWDNKPIRMTAEEILRAAAQHVSGSPAVDEAAEWLASVLAAGPHTAAALKAKAKDDGIHERTLLRAKARLRVATSREGFGLGGNWVWALPQG